MIFDTITTYVAYTEAIGKFLHTQLLATYITAQLLLFKIWLLPSIVSGVGGMGGISAFHKKLLKKGSKYTCFAK